MTDPVPQPARPPIGEDPYSWGSTRRYEGHAWSAATSGDILGSGSDPYRIFEIHLVVTESAWRQALRDQAHYHWLGRHYPAPPPPPDLIGWAKEEGYFPADWPMPGEVVG